MASERICQGSGIDLEGEYDGEYDGDKGMRGEPTSVSPGGEG